MDTDIHDLVLIHVSDKPASYARLEAIDPDVKRGWWRVKLLILTVPPQVVTWVLERKQIDGKPFTMGGTPVRLDRVLPPVTPRGGRGLLARPVPERRGREGHLPARSEEARIMPESGSGGSLSVTLSLGRSHESHPLLAFRVLVHVQKPSLRGRGHVDDADH